MQNNPGTPLTTSQAASPHAAPGGGSEDPRSASQQALILSGVCIAVLVLPLNFGGAAVSAPTIGTALGGSPVAINWILNAFMLSFGSSLMVAGALADLLGRKRVFAVGVVLFAATSLGISAAPSLAWVDFLRALQGISAALVLAGSSAALAQEFDGHGRARAFSLLGTTFGVGLALGPLLAGFLTQTFGWRSFFLADAAIGLTGFALGVPKLRESYDPHANGLDWPGAISFTAALTLFTFGLLQGPESGWSSPLIVALFVGAAVMAIAFVWIEGRVTRPMLDLSLFRYPRFVGVQVLPLATAFCYVTLLLVLPTRFIGIEGHTATGAGLMMVSLSAPMLIVPLSAAHLTRWMSAGVISAIGLVIAAIGMLWFSGIGPDASAAVIAIPLFVIGVGAGLPWGLMDGLSVSVVPKERAGMATGIFSTTRVAGEGMTLAVASAILAVLTRLRLSDALAGSPGAPAHAVTEAAQRVATGDLTHAAALLPALGQPLLVHAYDGAFRVLLHMLAAITLASAIMVLGFLGRTPSAASPDRANPALSGGEGITDR
ncbi:MFS transporter [Paraburkholderia sp. BL6669N2]|nr:MFS transporter [Paraburkholderia sp. BL6669N2]REG48864.1 MFS transporter [Paraburkholderia sp. BL6669N2]